MSTPSSPGPEGELSGRLELTWTNKTQRLLSDEAGGYTWVAPPDFRVAEVRLLHEAARVGTAKFVNASLLIRGDALHALTSLIELPEYRTSYAKKVKLAYLDPPFNTGEAFEHYDDNLEHSVWLTMMRDRLVQVRELLHPHGSVWVHLDDSEMAYCRVLMDEVFGRSAFVACIVWQKRYSRENRPAIGSVHDYILVYAPAGKDAWKQVRNRVPRESAGQYRNPNNDPRGRWRPIPMTAQGFRANQMYEIETPAGVVHKPPKGRCWSMVREKYDELLAAGRIYFGADDRGQPNVIRYLDEDEGLVPWTWWPHEETGHNDEAKKEILTLFPGVPAFDTPKPERLLRRIIHIATDPGDLVLDCFVGSGTSAAVAQKMGRRFIATERSPETLATFTLPRLEMVVDGRDPGGLTEELEWSGGGGFRVLDVAPSMFTASHGMVFLSEWATSGKLAQATAAQLGYEYNQDGPFVGRKGRTRLAVIDGLVNAAVVRMLVERLAAGELLEVAATSVDPAAVEVLRQLRRGSRLRKIPQAILRSYQRTSRLRTLLDGQVDQKPGRQNEAVEATT